MPFFQDEPSVRPIVLQMCGDASGSVASLFLS
jgi:hypothetical protein